MQRSLLPIFTVLFLGSCAYFSPNRNEIPINKAAAGETGTEDTSYVPGKGPRSTKVYTAENLRIEMSRGACYGTCPIYTLRILGDGTVRFEGIKFTKEEGIREAKISQEDLNRLVQKFEEVGFFGMKDRYENRGISDLPSTTVTINIEGKSKSVYKYFGAPDSFADLEKAIENISGAQAWIYR